MRLPQQVRATWQRWLARATGSAVALALASPRASAGRHAPAASGALALLLLLAFASAARVSGTQPQQAESPAPDVIPAEIRARLPQLHPQDPLAYFLLAEEVAEEVEEPARLLLAQSLYALAFELDRKRGGSGSLAASAALGLAQVERLDRDRRWLIALAGAMDSRYLLPDWNVSAWPSVSDDVAFKAATAIGLARAGEGREARRLLEQPGVIEVLRRYERALAATGGAGAVWRLERYVEQWPCRECGNARVVTRPGARGPEVRLCPTCQGNPGPRLSEEDLIAQLRFESALLSGIHRSWGAQFMADGGAPLRDPDPDELAATFGVDAARPYWRNGKWEAGP
jgi:hypothetical protein